MKLIVIAVVVGMCLATVAAPKLFPQQVFALQAKSARFTPEAAKKYAAREVVRVRQHMAYETPAEYAKIVPGCYISVEVVASSEG